jgi:hypothetical protein
MLTIYWILFIINSKDAMKNERIYQSKKQLKIRIDEWLENDNHIYIFEGKNTLILKKINRKLSKFANNSFDDQVTEEEINQEIHRLR